MASSIRGSATSRPAPFRLDGLRGFARSSGLGAACAVFLVVVALVAVFADRLAPYDPLRADYGAVRRPPGHEHWLGTDHLGRDTLSRLVHGARITLLVALSSVVIGDGLGFLWGLSSGYVGQRFDLISQRLVDVLLSFPALILAILLLAGLGAGVHTVVIAIALTRVPLSTRVIRSVVFSVKELAYIDAARALGARPRRIMPHHVAPQCVAPLLVIVSLNLGSAIFAEAALSFLGVGVPPPAPSWGNMLGGVLAEAFRPPWWLVVFPGLAITATIMATNLLGDALRDFLDPRLKGALGEQLARGRRPGGRVLGRVAPTAG
ncbi:MAG: ABC transporter permease [Candidatus Rokuibacteriota bacterium]|nr:MAG: ABC transporter permease [Candidatus Rokubacteria bacterium]